MNARMIADEVYAFGAIDWNRRLFDALIPLPDGTALDVFYRVLKMEDGNARQCHAQPRTGGR